MKFLTAGLQGIDGLRHGFFTRNGGVSEGLYGSLNCGLKNDDARENVMQNRARVAEAMGVMPECLVVGRQVHSATALVVSQPWAVEAATPECDALVTAEQDLALGVLTADCAPVLFVDPKERIIGAAHAGWRGAVGGIIEATVAEMKRIGAKPGNIHAAVGPCIGPAGYEVSKEFDVPFLAQDRENAMFFRPAQKPGHLYFDLPGYVTRRLKIAGVAEVYDTAQDTLSQENDFFSNRRAFLRGEKGFGLQISVISMK